MSRPHRPSCLALIRSVPLAVRSPVPSPVAPPLPLPLSFAHGLAAAVAALPSTPRPCCLLFIPLLPGLPPVLPLLLQLGPITSPCPMHCRVPACNRSPHRPTSAAPGPSNACPRPACCPQALAPQRHGPQPGSVLAAHHAQVPGVNSGEQQV